MNSRHISSLPAFSAIIALAAFASLRAVTAADPASVQVTSNVPYKSGEGIDAYEAERCKLDVYAPANGSGLPCVVWFHGGGLTGGDKAGKNTVAGCRALAAEGCVVASVSYRLSPRATYPAYAQDAAASVAWMFKNAEKYGGDPARIFVAGHSAGGYLTAMVGADESLLAAHGLSVTQLAGLIPLSGQMMTHYTIREERGLPKTKIIADDAAPISHASANTAPWLILYAEKDMTLRGDENRYFAAALKAAGNKHVTLREMAGFDHGGIGERLHEPGNAVLQAMVEFIRATAGATK